MREWDEQLAARLMQNLGSALEVWSDDFWHLYRMAQSEHKTADDHRALLAQRDGELEALRGKVNAWEKLAREAIEEFDDARGYATEYFTEKWGYDGTSKRFQTTLAALSDNEEGR